MILELSEAPPLHFDATTGPIREAVCAGDGMEALKCHLMLALAPSLGYCHYYDRGDIRCLEFRPRDEENPIRSAQAPYIEPLDEDSE